MASFPGRFLLQYGASSASYRTRVDALAKGPKLSFLGIFPQNMTGEFGDTIGPRAPAAQNDTWQVVTSDLQLGGHRHFATVAGCNLGGALDPYPPKVPNQSQHPGYLRRVGPVCKISLLLSTSTAPYVVAVARVLLFDLLDPCVANKKQRERGISCTERVGNCRIPSMPPMRCSALVQSCRQSQATVAPVLLRPRCNDQQMRWEGRTLLMQDATCCRGTKQATVWTIKTTKHRSPPDRGPRAVGHICGAIGLQQAACAMATSGT